MYGSKSAGEYKRRKKESILWELRKWYRIRFCVRSNENVSCSMIGGSAEGYKTSCKQKYVYRQLASVLSDGTVVPDTFRFPSSCCCHASFTANPYTRMGITINDQRSQVTPVKTSRRKWTLQPLKYDYTKRLLESVRWYSLESSGDFEPICI